jgi:flagellar hook-basal body complex protein FliE
MSPLSPINPLHSAYNLGPMSRVRLPDQAPGIQGPQPLGAPTEAGATQGADGSFANVLGKMVGEVNNKQLGAADAVNALQSGQNVSLHQAVIAMEEASVSFQLMVEVRNKLLDSYQELMRMQI